MNLSSQQIKAIIDTVEKNWNEKNNKNIVTLKKFNKNKYLEKAKLIVKEVNGLSLDTIKYLYDSDFSFFNYKDKRNKLTLTLVYEEFIEDEELNKNREEISKFDRTECERKVILASIESKDLKELNLKFLASNNIKIIY